MLQPFIPPDEAQPTIAEQPYVSLKAARPTSGWHWPREH